MNKIFIPFVLVMLISMQGLSQAYEGKTEYEKKKQEAFVIEFSYPPEAVETAFIDKMKQLGYKGKEEKGLFNKDKGFRIFKNAYVSDISNTRMDYIMQVERKSRKEKDESVLYMLIQKDGHNAYTGFDAAAMERAKDFLNGLQPLVEEAYLEMQIKEQEDILAKAEKKYKTLKDDQEDMEKKIKKLEEDIENNVKDQENTQKDIEAQKNLLESLKRKRKDL